MPTLTFRGQPIVSDQMTPTRLAVVWRELHRVLDAGVPGAVAEFGCHAGATSLFIRRALNDHHEPPARTFHVYDSFAGLPAKRPEDQSAAGVDFKQGELAVGKKLLLSHFRAASLRPPVVHKAWFEELSEHDVPPALALAFIDGDFYSSTLAALKLVWPRLHVGGCVLIDDYKRPELPGVTRAVEGFFRSLPPARAIRRAIRNEHNVAVITK